jgi:hypothetical protein
MCGGGGGAQVTGTCFPQGRVLPATAASERRLRTVRSCSDCFCVPYYAVVHLSIICCAGSPPFPLPAPTHPPTHPSLPGGRFFTTNAMVWEASGSPWVGPYNGLQQDFTALVGGLKGVAATLSAAAPINASAPLLPQDRGFLSTPVEDPLVYFLCGKVCS